MMTDFLTKAREQQPEVVSAYWNGRQILRIEDGETIFNRLTDLRPGLLTIHFDDSPTPAYFAAIP